MDDTFYFGCKKSIGAGHYLFEPGMKEVRLYWLNSEKFPFSLKTIDGGFLPKRSEMDTRQGHKDCQGITKLTHSKGFTIISFDDNSVDTRPGSHSTFIIKGELEFSDVLAKAREAFPEVFDRFKFEVRLL